MLHNQQIALYKATRGPTAVPTSSPITAFVRILWGTLPVPMGHSYSYVLIVMHVTYGSLCKSACNNVDVLTSCGS